MSQDPWGAPTPGNDPQEQGAGGPQYGSYPPPPAGSYPPPPAGSYPPPPAGSYPPPPAGAYPPPPAYGAPYQQQPQPGTAYGAAPGYPAGAPGGYPLPPVSVGEAFNYGWTKFTQNAGAVIGGSAIYIGALVVVVAALCVSLFTTMAVSIDPVTGEIANEGIFAGAMVGSLSVFYVAVIAISLVSGFVSMAVAVRMTNQGSVSFSDYFKFRGFWRYLGLGLLIMLASLVVAITIVGPLFVAYFAYYAPYLLLDKDASISEAIKGSFRLAKDNVGVTILTILAAAGIAIVGELACGVGLLVALPVAGFMTAYVYKRLIQDRPL